MQKSFIIELKIGEFMDRHSAAIDDSFYHLDIDIESVIEEFLEEKIGGMLCLDDCHIPQLRFIENGHRNCRLEIDCCCEKQCLLVEKRLNEILRC
jgi:hypothetical protein